MKVFIGDLNTLQVQKQEMPMLGGFMQEENFTVGYDKTSLDGTKNYRDIVYKKRFIFDFINMLHEHFHIWEAQKELLLWREIDIENEDGSFSTYVVNYTDLITYSLLRTNKPWLYGQVSFIFEEV